MEIRQINTVRIVVGESYGTGLMYFPEESSFFYIITARHVIHGDDLSNKVQNDEIIIDNISLPGLSSSSYTLNGPDRVIHFENMDDLAILVIGKEGVFAKIGTPQNTGRVASDFGLLDCSIVGFPRFAGMEELREIVCEIRGFSDGDGNHFLIESKKPLLTLYDDGMGNVGGLSGSAVFLHFLQEPYLLGIVTEYSPIDSFRCIGLAKINELLALYQLPLLATGHLVVNPQTRDAIRSIHRNNKAVKAKIKDKIGTVHVPRQELSNMTGAFEQNKLMVIHGNAGVGKSAFANEVVSHFQADHEVILFSGEQLCFETMDLVLGSLPDQIAVPFEDIIVNPAFRRKKIIWIESIEKLLETNKIEAFIELLSSVSSNSNLKILVTIRTYMLDQFNLWFSFNLPSETEVHEVPLFSDQQLGVIERTYPGIDALLSKNNINNLLRIPFYLTYAVNLLQILNSEEDLNEAKFRDIIWQEAIRKGDDNRSRVFEALSVRRAKEMSLFTIVPADQSVIKSLYQDNLITFENDELQERYCPSHDVLEDWALMRYISRIKRDAESTEAFFHSVGNEPAIRRAFRLWMAEAIQRINPGLVLFIQEIVQSNSINKYWKDETYVSILRSDYAGNFIDANEELLLQNNQYLAYRFIQLLKTACKEEKKGAGASPFPTLIGDGWASMVKFLYSQRSHLQKYQEAILFFLFEWQAKCYNGCTINTEEGRSAGLLTLHILDGLKRRFDHHDRRRDLSTLLNKGIRLAFSLTGYIHQEMKEFLEAAEAGANRDVESPNFQVIAFNEKVVIGAIDGTCCSYLCRYLPDTVIELFQRKIRMKPPNRRDHIFSERNEAEHHFGLEHDYDYRCYPASIYQTPIFWLLKAHPLKGLKLIVELMNYCVTKYIASEYSKNDEILQIKLVLNDGTEVFQYGSSTLWQMYRGGGIATPEVLRSVLMSLENYLFDCCESDHPDTQPSIQRIFDFLYRRSESVTITAVLASVALRFPNIVGEMTLPLYTSKHIFLWEVGRFIGELHFSETRFFGEDSIHDDEKRKADALPHRHYHYGISQLVITQLTQNVDFRDRILVILDRHHAEITEEDEILWAKILTEIDIRKWRAELVPEEPNKVYLTPNYEGRAKAFVEEGQESARRSNPEAVFSAWINESYQKKEIPGEDYPKLKKIIEYYQAGQFVERLFKRPCILAIVGLRNYHSRLTEGERSWCIATISDTVRQIIHERFLHEYSSGVPPYALFDIEPCFSFFPSLLFSFEHSPQIAAELQALYCKLLLAPLHDHEVGKVLKAARADLWRFNPDFAFKCFSLLLAFAILIEKRDSWRKDHWEWDNDARIKDTDTLIGEVLACNGPKKVSLELTSHTHTYYSRALCIIPADQDRQVLRDFAAELLKLHLATFHIDRRQDESSNYYEDRVAIGGSLPAMILNQPITFGKSIVDLLYTEYEADKNENARYSIQSKKQEYIEDLITRLIRSLDQSISLPGEDLRIGNFWEIWQYLHERNKSIRKRYFSDQLLLNIEWRETAKNWKPLDNKTLFMKELIEFYGTYDLSPVLNLLGTIADEILMPVGISIFVKLFKSQTAGQRQLYGARGVKFVQRAIYRHGRAIKLDKTLLDDFIFILDKLSDFGSSEAYFIRDYMITYRAP